MYVTNFRFAAKNNYSFLISKLHKEIQQNHSILRLGGPIINIKKHFSHLFRINNNFINAVVKIVRNTNKSL